ncbi:arsenite methyltransferase [Halomarina oriensis]|uniref:Arsenite methyltransferase n=1 Tax=Halomarina oriensis TaxID=671145 RepID=A0A6B0GQ83_9EURY|nr:arsenite methyltransferase [Halomarina oriensis]MWG34285.1 arsenite methyltransferase [Halomarina oriensis]
MSDPDGAVRSAADQRRLVRERYAGIAAEGSGGGCCADGCECGCDSSSADEQSRAVGYDDEALDSVVEGANLGLGCGNPTAIANLNAGETVLDLGSGAGFDCFLAAQAVGPTGRVLGVDMTPEMVEKARENARRNDAETVEFRLGEIEHLPVADEAVDVVVSNCVVNLSPDKERVFAEAFRVLRPGGRVAISDVVQTAPFPDDVREDPEALAACVSGAATVADLEEMLDTVGFEAVAIAPKDESASFIREWNDSRDLSEFLVSSAIEARKPRR